MIYAGFWRRFWALCLDGLILFLPSVALNMAIPYAGAILIVLFYYPVFESSVMQATPGKYWMGLKVLNEKGQSLTFLQALARFLLKYVSTALLLIGYLVQLFTEKRQTLHDIITGAVVVRHQYTQSPDWIKTWINQLKFILNSDHLFTPVDTGSTTAESGHPGWSAQGDAANGAADSFKPSPSESGGQSSAGASYQQSPTGSGAQSAHQTKDVVESIEKLHELYKAGALTEEEFQNKKSELLKQI